MKYYIDQNDSQQERRRVFQQKLKGRENIAIFSFIAVKLDYSNLYTRHREHFQTWIFSVLARNLQMPTAKF
jgi:hypothetical protein